MMGILSAPLYVQQIALQWCLLYIFGVTHFRFHIHSSLHWLHLTVEITWISFLLHTPISPHRGSHGVGVRMTRGFSGDMTKSWDLWCNNWHLLTNRQVSNPFFVVVSESWTVCLGLHRLQQDFTPPLTNMSHDKHMCMCVFDSIENWICQGPLLLLKVQFYNGICLYVTWRQGCGWMNRDK